MLKTASFWRIAAILAVVTVVVLALQSQAPRAGDAPVIVELFTSQGCSSCPPADELLRRIAHEPKFRGKVIPLAYHVDYWNHLGWRDPFSAREWSQRQGDYVRALKLESAYTPQAIVNGTRQLVGSSSFALYRAIDEESHRKPEGSVSLTRNGTALTVRAQSPRPDVDLIVVTFDNQPSTRVERGENGGRTLVNDTIVRALTRLATLDGRNPVEKQLPIAPHLGAAAFLQERSTRRILASAAVTAEE
jgi:hypothetical protein